MKFLCPTGEGWMLRAFGFAIFMCLMAVPAKAQDQFWVQIEARQTLAEATERARLYARRFDDVQGYYLGRGFYGIVLGPYSEALARQELRRLLGSGQIPGDSYLQTGRRFEQQFWPIGGATVAPLPEEIANEEPGALAQEPITGQVETLAEARASEAQLLRSEREELQKALRWAGFYNSAIDGAFGRGTRRAMEDWQSFNGFPPTGVLTTRQRQVLLQQYNQDLVDVGMETIQDIRAGIQIQLPLSVVAFDSYAPPFAKFTPTGSLPNAQVLLISQPGDRSTLAGLYEVMQTLEIIPPEGPRSLRGDSFTIEGIGNGIHSYTTATLQDGAIKGFTLVWDDRDDRRRTRILETMQDSFARLDAVLDPNLNPPGAEQSIDLVSGLAVRQPTFSQSGFYVTTDGTVVTSDVGLDQCERLTIDRTTDADMLASFPDFGLAILQPQTPLAPLEIGTLQTAVPRLQDPIGVAGYPFDGVLTAPTMIFGNLIDLRNLQGDERVIRLSVVTRASNAGGPVLDAGGAVLGMLLPRRNAALQALPEDVQFALKSEVVTGLLENAGLTVRQTDQTTPLGNVALQRVGSDISVLVSCW
ncbi:MAG: serine protease [Pseudomonadota bacterium]